MESSVLTLAVMITTKNRLHDLERTMRVLQRLDPLPEQILITADGCTDETVERVQRELPSALLYVNDPGLGSVASRDRMLQSARCDLVLSLDDDSYPEQGDCVARLKELFAAEKAVSVAHFPQRSDEYPESLVKSDFGASKLTGSYPNSGACYRRQDYLDSSGFPAEFFHAYEEPDYALQVVAAGKQVLYTPILTIRHHYSPVERSEMHTHQRHARNELWSAILRCPLPWLLWMLPYRVFSQARYAASRGIGWLLREPQWWWDAVKGIPAMLSQRKPVGRTAYHRWLRLLRTPENTHLEN